MGGVRSQFTPSIGRLQGQQLGISPAETTRHLFQSSVDLVTCGRWHHLNCFYDFYVV